MNVKELIEEVENDLELATYISLVPKRIRRLKLTISNR